VLKQISVGFKINHNTTNLEIVAKEVEELLDKSEKIARKPFKADK
jgi:hypothetical protein